MKMMDIVIIGGGITGLALASALRHSGLKIAVLDCQSPEAALSSYSLRVSALNPGTECFLQALGAWQHIGRSQPFKQVSVWEQDSQAHLLIDAATLNTDHLGTIVENNRTQQALLATLSDASSIEVRQDADIMEVTDHEQGMMIRCADGSLYFSSWLVAADGAQSRLRQQFRIPMAEWQYEQSAIVANVRTEKNHGAVARQIFTPYGPLAFLPLPESNLVSIVWTLPTTTAQLYAAMDDEAFNHRLTTAFEAELGVCLVESERQVFPLTARYAREQVKSRLILLGDAAHTIHPLAGQGINLGLRDVKALSEELVSYREQYHRLPDAKALRHYERARKADAVQALASMEFFKQLFAGSNPIKKWIRTQGLHYAGQAQPLLKPVLREVLGIESPKI